MADVPNLDGVPSLDSYSSDTFTLLVSDVLSVVLDLFVGPTFGIFLDGVQVLDYDNFVSFRHKQSFVISTYPVEKGSFQSYNKVQVPAEIHVRIATGGAIADRQSMLSSIDSVMNTIDLYDVVTPEAAYIGYNFMHREMDREATSGAGLIPVDLVLMQVLQTAQATFQTVQTPSIAGTQSTGVVQPQDLPSADTAAAQAAMISKGATP